MQISDGANSGDKMDINRQSLLEQDGKKVSNTFFVEKHNEVAYVENQNSRFKYLPGKKVLPTN